MKKYEREKEWEERDREDGVKKYERLRERREGEQI